MRLWPIVHAMHAALHIHDYLSDPWIGLLWSGGQVHTSGRLYTVLCTGFIQSYMQVHTSRQSIYNVYYTY